MLYEASTLYQLKDKFRVYEKVHPIGKTLSYSPLSSQVHKAASKVSVNVNNHKCFICSSPDYFAKNCSERKLIKCFKCAQFGHKKNECKSNFQTITDKISVAERIIFPYRIYKDIKKWSNFSCYTGSDVCIISRKYSICLKD